MRISKRMEKRNRPPRRSQYAGGRAHRTLDKCNPDEYIHVYKMVTARALRTVGPESPCGDPCAAQCALHSLHFGVRWRMGKKPFPAGSSSIAGTMRNIK